MRRTEHGFSLVELLVAMTVFVFVMAASSNLFLSVLGQFKQQTMIAETGLEELVGLDLLRRDIEHAGFGLPWIIPNTTSYTEGGVGDAYRDTSPNPPRAVVGGDGGGLNSSDVLVVRGANVVSDPAAHKWTLLRSGNSKVDGLSGNPAFASDDHIIVMEPGITSDNERLLVLKSGSTTVYAAEYSGTSDYAPPPDQTNVVYGIATDDGATGTLAMPFNRADFLVTTTLVDVPSSCASGTGVLVKREMNPYDGTTLQVLPLLDCVADMQVGYGWDTDENGMVDTTNDTLPASSATAAGEIRNKLKEVTVHILAHEGKMDRNYTHATPDITVPLRTGDFDVSDKLNYRWKLHTLVVTPNNLQ